MFPELGKGVRGLWALAQETQAYSCLCDFKLAALSLVKQISITLSCQKKNLDMPLQFQISICHKYLLNRKGIKASIIFHYQLSPSV